MGRLVYLYLYIVFAVTSYARYFEINWRNTTDIGRLPAKYRDQCVVSVQACESAGCKKVYTNATVYVLTRNGSDDYLGYDHDVTGSKGRACVLTACDHDAYVLVRSQPDTVRNYELMFAATNLQSLPVGYAFSLSQMNQLMDFRVLDRGSVTVNGRIKTGPVYETIQECKNSKSEDFTFNFFFIAQQETLQTKVPLTTHQNELSWYYADPRKNTYESCFLKITVKSVSGRLSVATATSTDDTGKWYGTYTVGAKSAPSSSDRDIKTACVEYRCTVHDERGRLKDTTVTGSMSLQDDPSSFCTITGTYGISEATGNTTHYSITLHADENYGSFYGVYKHRDREIGKAMCLTGQSFLYPNFEMNPRSHNFATFDCTGFGATVG